MELIILRFFYIIILVSNLFGSYSWANTLDEPQSNNLTPVTLQLLWKHQFEFAGFYAAKAKGFYEDIGLDVTLRELNKNENPTKEVLSGRAQYGINDSSLIIERGNNKPVVLLSNIFQHSPMILIAKSDSGISSPAHMVGKKSHA